MDVFDFDDNLKTEKTNATLSCHRLRNFAKLFRLFELCLVLFFLSWTSTRLPFAVRISGEYFRQLVAIIVSPTFIFLLSNVIIIALVAKYGQFSSQSPIDSTVETDLYDEFIKNSENRSDFISEISPPVPEPEEIVYQDKQIILNAVNSDCENSEIKTNANPISESKKFRRSQSENLKQRESPEKPNEKLRRSETEKFREVVISGEKPEETECFVEKLSNEEFQRTIEAFIAKQVRFHQEEKICIVPHTTQS